MMHTHALGHEQRAAQLTDKRSVSMEAERRINEGTLINGIRFRCDTDSISRLEGLVRGGDHGKIGPEGKTYKTSAGVDITFTTKEQVQAVLNTADDHRDWILERSAQIQNYGKRDRSGTCPAKYSLVGFNMKRKARNVSGHRVTSSNKKPGQCDET